MYKCMCFIYMATRNILHNKKNTEKNSISTSLPNPTLPSP